MDTTSKILAPGLRVGWITGSSQIIELFKAHMELSVTSPSGPSQVMLYKLLDETWGHDGFINFLSHLSAEYRKRLDILLGACTRCLSSDICHWAVPREGMFVWIRVDWLKHPEINLDDGPLDRPDLYLKIEDKVYVQSKANGVQISKRSWFSTTGKDSIDMRFRLTFAAAPKDSLVTAIERFGAAVRAEFHVL